MDQEGGREGQKRERREQNNRARGAWSSRGVASEGSIATNDRPRIAACTTIKRSGFASRSPATPAACRRHRRRGQARSERARASNDDDYSILLEHRPGIRIHQAVNPRVARRPSVCDVELLSLCETGRLDRSILGGFFKDRFSCRFVSRIVFLHPVPFRSETKIGRLARCAPVRSIVRCCTIM